MHQELEAFTGRSRADIVSRVLFVNDMSFVVETLVPDLVSLGIDVQLIGRRAEDPSLVRRPFARQAVSSLLAVFKSKPHDIIHVNYGLFGFLAIPDFRSAAILHIHGSEIRPSNNWRIRFANLVSVTFSKVVDSIWYSTPDLREHLREVGLTPTFMPNPIPPQFFRTQEPVLQEDRILFAIPLSMEKGADIAIDAVRILQQRLPGVKITALGWGPYPTEAMALRARMPDGVELLPWMKRDEFSRTIANSTVVVGQLRLRILGNVELETMALGRPLVAGLKDELYRSEPYYDTPPPILQAVGAEEVAQHVEGVIADTASARLMGMKSHDWVLRHHAAEHVARMYRDAYEKLSQETRRPT